ncbi:unnamed protein product [Alopecurus aequalis]
MLGQNWSTADGNVVAQILNVESTTFEEKYLGLPVPDGRLKNGKFQPTKERLQKKCSDWSEKYTSGAAKETLIKSVAQAISTYAMSVFKFSAGLCDELSQIIRNYWWGDDFDKRKVHWMGWDKMTRPKIQGGIGFRDLRLFNQALLAKQAWRLLEYPESLCARLLKAKYYPSGELLDTVFPKNASPCWQGITHGLELLKQGMIWRINSGTKIRVWRDNWLPRGNLKPMGYASKLKIKWVSDLIDPQTKTWREDLVREVFYPPDADWVLQIRLPAFNGDDWLAWSCDQTGMFSVKSAYRLALDLKDKELGTGTSSKPARDRDLWNVIWKTNVPPKICVFGWKLASNSLGVQATRCDRNTDMVATCSICGREDETSHHAMVVCTKAKALRQRLREEWGLPEEEKLQDTGNDWVLILLSQLDEHTRAKMLFLWWRAWHIRNNIIFGDGKCGIEQSAQFFFSYYEVFQQAKGVPEKVDTKGKQIVLDLVPNLQKKQRTPTETWKKPRLSNVNFVEQVKSWSKPPPGWCKLNFDAGFIESTNTGSWGAILRNEHGQVLLSAWGRLDHCPNAEVAEAVAGTKSIKAILHVCSKPVIVENDCVAVIKALQSRTPNKATIADLVKDMQLSLNFVPDFKFSKVNRVNNSVAHELANLGYREPECVLVDSAPPCLAGLIDYDCNQNMLR